MTMPTDQTGPARAIGLDVSGVSKAFGSFVALKDVDLKVPAASFHAILGEKVGACVVRAPHSAVSRDELVAHCRGYLASYKCPDEIAFVDAVAKTSRGKVPKATLRALFA